MATSVLPPNSRFFPLCIMDDTFASLCYNLWLITAESSMVSSVSHSASGTYGCPQPVENNINKLGGIHNELQLFLAQDEGLNTEIWHFNHFVFKSPHKFCPQQVKNKISKLIKISDKLVPFWKSACKLNQSIQSWRDDASAQAYTTAIAAAKNHLTFCKLNQLPQLLKDGRKELREAGEAANGWKPNPGVDFEIHTNISFVIVSFANYLEKIYNLGNKINLLIFHKTFFQCTGILPDLDAFAHIFGFLTPNDLARAECVCRDWNQVIRRTDQWKKQCQNRLNIPTEIDPTVFLPTRSLSYKQCAILPVKTKVYDEKIYQHVLRVVGIELASAIPEAYPLTRAKEPDPFDQAKTIGQNFVWLVSPSYYYVFVDQNFPYELDKPDDPNDEDAPALIRKEVVEPKVLKVPNSIDNLSLLFNHPRNGHPSKHKDCLEIFGGSSRFGKKRISSGTICMRESVIEGSRTLREKASAGKQSRDALSQLGYRMLYNLLKHAETGTYPDSSNKLDYALTPTLDSQGKTCHLIPGTRSDSGGCMFAGDFPTPLGVYAYD